MVVTRSSMRLAARPSTVPVAEQATRKLMRELDFINKPSPAPDAAITAFVDRCTEQVVMAIRAALAAIAQGQRGLRWRCHKT
jgi:hypothetical protein